MRTYRFRHIVPKYNWVFDLIFFTIVSLVTYIALYYL